MFKTLEEEKDSIDLVTNSMFSISFLDTITLAIFNSNTNSVSLIDFYKDWLHKIGVSKPKIPFNLGIFSGYLFCGLLITKENWSNLLPDKAISTLNPEWGLSEISCLPLSNNDPRLPQFIRHIRNALSHANFTIQMPKPEEINGDLNKMHLKTKWTFKDSDCFEVTLTMIQLEKLIKKFQGVVHQDVRTKIT